MRKYTAEQHIINHKERCGKNLILVEVKDGVARFTVPIPEKYDTGIIDLDGMDGRCPICYEDCVPIRINGKLKDYCVECDFWFELG